MRITTVGVAVAVLAWATACGDDAAASKERVTRLIGPAGGMLELAGGGKVTIPEGALTEPVTITITKLERQDVADLPAHMEHAGTPYAFEPHGQSFAAPVQVELPFDDAATSVRPMKLRDKQDSAWVTVFPSEADDETKRLAFDTLSFSVYAPTRPKRDSGYVVLPDGALVDPDGGTFDSGLDATIEVDGGMDAMIEVDGGMDAMVEMDATVAPPGRIVFVRETGNDPPADLFSRLEDGTGLVPLATSADDEFFSAHGTRTIVYGRLVGGQNDLHIIDVDGTNAHTLASTNVDEYAAAVAPDGRVIYMVLHSENPDLYSVNADGTGTTPLAATSEAETFLAVTPQGRVIYRVANGIGFDIRSIGVDGTSPAALAVDPATDDVFDGVTPAGDVIFTSYDMLGEGGVYSVSQHGGGVTTLGSSTNFSLEVAGITSLGAVLLRTNVGGDLDLFGPGMVPLSTTAGELDEYLASTRSGQVIFRVQDGAGQDDIFRINADGSGLVTLAADDALSMGFIAIAPNDRVLYTDGTALHAVDSDGSDPQTLAPAFVSAWVSGDNRVIYERDDGSVSTLRAVDLDGTRDTPLSPAGVSAFFVAWTLSGKVVFRTEVDDADFFIVDDDGTNLIPIGMTANSEYFQTIIE